MHTAYKERVQTHISHFELKQECNIIYVQYIMESGTSCTNEVCCLRSYLRTQQCDRFVGYDHLPAMSRSKAPIWTQLWRKIDHEKKRDFACSISSMRFTYDTYSYAQNFDQGLIWTDDYS